MTRPFDVADFIGWLNQFHLDYLLIGGHAMRAWGSPRFTHDFDFWFRPADRRVILEHLETDLGFELSSPPHAPRPVVTANRDSAHVDCLFVRGMTSSEGQHLEFDEVFARAAAMAGQALPTVRVPQVADLLALKRMRREPTLADLQDIKFLEIRMREDRKHPGEKGD